MQRKDKIQWHHSEDLDTVDTELADAMDRLDLANDRVGEILRVQAPDQKDAVAVQPMPPPEAPADIL